MDKQLIETLRESNQRANFGRGSTTIRIILNYLDRGDIDSARTIWNLDSDKVSQYTGMTAIGNRIFGTDFTET
jgi:hypothetical protein